MIPEALKPCPFCGSVNRPKLARMIADLEGEPVVPGFVAICSAYGFDDDRSRGCGAVSGYGEDEDEAVAAWNRRALPPPPIETGEI